MSTCCEMAYCIARISHSVVPAAEVPYFSSALIERICASGATPIVIESVGLSLRSLLIERGTLLADLDVDMLASADGLLCEFAHRPSLFDRTLIEALMADFGTILRLAAREPGALVSELCRRGCAGVHSG